MQARVAYPVLILALLSGAPALGGTVAVRVQAGDLSVTALGEGSSASVNLGAIPTTAKPGCRRVDVRVGNINKIAEGRNARASVTIPETQTDCQEQPP